ncbi:MAG TPA: hypothetical protein VJ001_02110 [Rhodocyclaceae bacterium]|nr:hypothetical protein [Rhodocyclaceae bacterium]
MSDHSDHSHEDKDPHGLRAILALYWRAYGGWSALLGSAFFWLSIALLVVTSPYWLKPSNAWWSQTLSVMPNLLGFTLGGFAVFLAFGDDQFKKLISGSVPQEDGPSPYLEVSATFLHFVLIQVAALIAAIIGNATTFTLPGCLAVVSSFLASIRVVGDLFGYWLFLYGISSAAAAAIAIFRVAYWYDSYQGK